MPRAPRRMTGVRARSDEDGMDATPASTRASQGGPGSASADADGSGRPLKILAVSRTWQGANDYAYVRAFRRAGHSVNTVDPATLAPVWRGHGLRAVRRALHPLMVREMNAELVALARRFGPDVLFVYKGREVTAEAVDAIRSGGAVAVNVFPDTSFSHYGPHLPRAISRYDAVFTTKPFGPADLARNYGQPNGIFLEHAFDPEVHTDVSLAARDRERYGCDVAFAGAMTPKKARLVNHLMRAMPDLSVRLWGNGWRRAEPPARDVAADGGVFGLEYAKAIRAAKIALGLLHEGDPGAPSGDRTTARTFEIPACGAFMLHERTAEAEALFSDGAECAFFDGPDDLVAKVRRWLADPAGRARIAAAGRARAIASGYSVETRAAEVLAHCRALAAARSAEPRRG